MDKQACKEKCKAAGGNMNKQTECMLQCNKQDQAPQTKPAVASSSNPYGGRGCGF
jgi:hypothetical protein